MRFDNPHISDGAPRMGNALTRGIGSLILKLIGWKVSGQLPNRQKVIIIGGPHTSNWDLILAMSTMLAVGLKFSWVMKIEAFFWPFGALWKTLGGIPIDRSAKLNKVEQMVQWFTENETVWLGFTPEGTRSKVERYKTGYLRIAKAAQVPLFIVGVDGASKTVVLDRLWDPVGEVDAENAAIKSYIESRFSGVRPDKV